MKARSLLPLLAAALAPLALHAQQPPVPPRDAPQPPPGPSHERGQDERAQHLREALRHLRAAGMEEVASRIEHMQADKHRGGPGGEHRGQSHARHRGPEKGPQAPQPQSQGGIEELRREVRALAAQVSELRRASGPQHPGPQALARPQPPRFDHEAPRPEARREEPRRDGGDRPEMQHRDAPRRADGEHRPDAEPRHEEGRRPHPERRPEGARPPEPERRPDAPPAPAPSAPADRPPQAAP